MDFCAAREWLDGVGSDPMADRKKQKLQREIWQSLEWQKRRAIMGNIRSREATAPPPTLPQIKGPSLAEIEAKYGK